MKWLALCRISLTLLCAGQCGESTGVPSERVRRTTTQRCQALCHDAPRRWRNHHGHCYTVGSSLHVTLWRSFTNQWPAAAVLYDLIHDQSLSTITVVRRLAVPVTLSFHYITRTSYSTLITLIQTDIRRELYNIKTAHFTVRFFLQYELGLIISLQS